MTICLDTFVKGKSTTNLQKFVIKITFDKILGHFVYMK